MLLALGKEELECLVVPESGACKTIWQKILA